MTDPIVMYPCIHCGKKTVTETAHRRWEQCDSCSSKQWHSDHEIRRGSDDTAFQLNDSDAYLDGH
jgi:ribosomal protein L37AE/L43A